MYQIKNKIIGGPNAKKDYSVRELIALGEKNNKIDLAKPSKRTLENNDEQKRTASKNQR